MLWKTVIFSTLCKVLCKHSFRTPLSTILPSLNILYVGILDDGWFGPMELFFSMNFLPLILVSGLQLLIFLLQSKNLSLSPMLVSTFFAKGHPCWLSPAWASVYLPFSVVLIYPIRPVLIRLSKINCWSGLLPFSWILNSACWSGLPPSISSWVKLPTTCPTLGG